MYLKWNYEAGTLSKPGLWVVGVGVDEIVSENLERTEEQLEWNLGTQRGGRRD